MLGNLTTEGRNPASNRIDALSPQEIVRLMNAEDRGVAAAVGQQADRISLAIEQIAARVRSGGRLIYIGAGTSGRLGVLGTSGRLGVLDAAECPPTFNTPPGLVIGLIAGGPAALTRAVEGAEDAPEAAIADLDGIALSERDAVVGIASSGRTPYVIGGLKHARALGAYAIGFSCNAQPELAGVSDLTITPIVGPEVISGSTRLKAGTATKLVLNMLTTGAMVRLGKTYGNLMVDLRATNSKLRERTRRLARELTGLPDEMADDLLTRCDGELKTAVVAHRQNIGPAEARVLLEQSGGHLRSALEAVLPGGASGSEPTTVHIAEAAGAIRVPIVAGHPQVAEEIVLGIDGGGSKTVAWLACRGKSEPWDIIGRGMGGPSNPNAVGFTAAFANLDRAIDAAFQEAGLPPREVPAACGALAGSDRDSDRRAIEEWAQRRKLSRRLKLVHDAMPLLAAGTPAGWGVALIAGTGSLAFGRGVDGSTARAGGWGHLMGDEGSGYAISCRALQAAAQGADGRGPETALLALFMGRLDVARPSELVTQVYRPRIDRSIIATWADIVFEAAEAGDPVAQAIIAQGARDLAAAVAAVCRKPGFAETPFPLALGGGLLIHRPSYREAVLAALSQQGLQAAPVASVPDPVAGAVLLAGEMLATA
jgi:N-acetylmuramic acid 6-phosphate etherase